MSCNNHFLLPVCFQYLCFNFPQVSLSALLEQNTLKNDFFNSCLNKPQVFSGGGCVCVFVSFNSLCISLYLFQSLLGKKLYWTDRIYTWFYLLTTKTQILANLFKLKERFLQLFKAVGKLTFFQVQPNSRKHLAVLNFQYNNKYDIIILSPLMRGTGIYVQ